MDGFERLHKCHNKRIYVALLALFWLGTIWTVPVLGVSVTQIQVPAQVRDGETVDLSCDFDLETQSLYSLNWWKGSQQFYQFSPAGAERKVVYKTPGVEVVLPKSDMKNVVLRNVTLKSSGQYKCEIVAFPSYERDLLAASMEVVEVPRSKPVISLRRVQYNVGDILKANCTSSGTKPPSQLIWHINGEMVKSRHSTALVVSASNSWLDDVLEDSPDVIHLGNVDDLYSMQTNEIPLPPIKSFLRVPLRSFHFVNGGRINLSCSATFRGLYHKLTEVQLTLPGVSPVEPSQRISKGGTLRPSLFKMTFIFASLQVLLFVYFGSILSENHACSTL